jgi:D-3-phosphoglycerate dehydrogenase
MVLQDRGRAHRVVHIHQNTPGVLAAMNSLFGAEKVNIDGQSLATRGEIGYVVTDVAADVPDAVLTGLSELPETIRLRVLL